jgi:Reverse transcriptase (RNA-dependent DNA polymerase)
MIRVHLIFDVKQDGRRKARCVAGGHMTGPNTDTYYSCVVSLRLMWIAIFLAELNGYQLSTGDIVNAYLEATTDEKVCFIAGKEFTAFGHDGHLMIIVKALYGLKTSGARFHEKFADYMRQLGYIPSRADSDVWMKDCVSHWEYVCTYVDDVIYGGKDPGAYFQGLRDMGYKLKGVGEPKYHLGGDFIRVSEPEDVLTWGSHTYVKGMMANYGQMFGEPVSKREVHAPLEPGDHPELDDSELLDTSGVKIYWQMICEMQWAVALGRIDLISATVAMARFRPASRKGHLDRLKRVYTYLRNYKKTAIKFNVEIPDYSRYEVLPCN